MKRLVMWQYCRDPNAINTAILTKDENWEGLVSADQIISISWDNNQQCYSVFWWVGYDDSKLTSAEGQ